MDTRPEYGEHRQAHQKEIERQAPTRKRERAAARVTVKRDIKHMGHRDGRREEQKRHDME